jgi:hypothetical protein
VALEDVHHPLAVGRVGLVARRPEGRGRRDADHLEVVRGGLREVEEVLVDDPADAVAGAVDVRDERVLAGLEDDADQALVDDRRRAAALRHRRLAFEPQHVAPFRCAGGASPRAIVRSRELATVIPRRAHHLTKRREPRGESAFGEVWSL